jgi:hypothetical protein
MAAVESGPLPVAGSPAAAAELAALDARSAEWSVSLGEAHVVRVRGALRRADVQIAAGQWEPALVSVTAAVRGMRRVLDPHTPQLAVEVTRKAKLLHHLGHAREAARLFAEAELVLTRSHGPDSPIVMSVRDAARQAAAEAMSTPPGLAPPALME